MLKLTRTRTPLFFKNRERYLSARKKGLKPFQEKRLAPWEKRLVAKSLLIVLNYGVGYERRMQETNSSVDKIIPFTIKELKRAMIGRIPTQQYDVFLKIMNLCSKYHTRYLAGNTLPEEMINQVKLLEPNSWSVLSNLIGKETILRPEEKKPPLEKMTFKENIEYQLRHDIGDSFFVLQTMLNKAIIDGNQKIQ